MFSTSWLATAFSIDRGTLRDRLRVVGAKSIPGPNSSKLYLLTDAIKASVDLLDLPDFGPEEDDNQIPTDPAAKKLYYEAEIEEMRYRVETGELVNIRLVVQDITQLFKTFAINFQLPAKRGKGSTEKNTSNTKQKSSVESGVVARFESDVGTCSALSELSQLDTIEDAQTRAYDSARHSRSLPRVPVPLISSLVTVRR